MNVYTTVSGDMWDSISYKLWGTYAYTGNLMSANPQYLADNFIFPAGIELVVPEITTADSMLENLPPWRR